jgi:hypothetical protein
MTIGSVSATALNLRASPGGQVVAVLRQRCPVQIFDEAAGWLRVSATQDGVTRAGWLSAEFIAHGNSDTAVPSNPITPSGYTPPAWAIATLGGIAIPPTNPCRQDFVHPPRFLGKVTTQRLSLNDGGTGVGWPR